jgi:hypothetical protein
MISAVFSRFSGGLSGWIGTLSRSSELIARCVTYRLCQEEIMVFWLNAKVFEYRIRPKSLHMILRKLAYRLLPDFHKPYPVLNLSMSDRIMYAIA